MHTWLLGALFSITTGAVQLFIDMGLVDQAKQITQHMNGETDDV